MERDVGLFFYILGVITVVITFLIFAYLWQGLSDVYRGPFLLGLATLVGVGITQIAVGYLIQEIWKSQEEKL